MNLQLQLNCCKRVVKDVKSSHEMIGLVMGDFLLGQYGWNRGWWHRSVNDDGVETPLSGS